MSGYGQERFGQDIYGGSGVVPPPPPPPPPPLPGLPGAIPAIIAIPGSLPALVHVIRGPGGRTDYPEIVHGFSATEVNGFDTIEGTVEAERVKELPDIYTDGAQWLVTDSESGEVVAGGDLFDPGISAGRAILRADGWGKRLQRRVDRYLLQSKRYSDWSESSGDPLALHDPVFPADPDVTDSVIQVDSTGGRLLFTIPDQTRIIGGKVNRLAFWAQGATISRIAFDWEQRADVGIWTLAVHTARGPNGQLHGQLSELMAGLTGSEDILLPSDAHDDLVTIGLRHTGVPITSDGYWLRIKNLRVNDIAVGDVFTFDDLVRDVGGRMGFSIRLAGASINVLPMDTVGESLSAVLDYGSLIEDQGWRVIGLHDYTPILETFDWGEEVWELADPEFPIEPIPLPRFDRLDMPFRYPNSSVIGYVTVQANDRLPIPRSFGQVQLDQPGEKLAMAALGERLLKSLSRRRYAGQVTFTRGVINGEFRTAHLFHGGSVYLPDQDVTCRVKSFTRNGSGVTVTLDDQIAPYDRILARRQRRLASRGLA